MLSFVEENLIWKRWLNSEAKMVLKIESPRGLDFMSHADFNCHLAAHDSARDDLMINIGDNKTLMIAALYAIIEKDPNAIIASRIFSGIESDGNVSMGDLSDLKLMQMIGYKNFMLSDGICDRHFDRAIKAWKDFQEVVLWR